MKSSRTFYFFTATSVVLGCLALPLAHSAGAINLKTNQVGSAASKGATNSEPATLTIPVSAFDLAANPTKDPFFPNSVRKPVMDKTAKPLPGVGASSFQLTGLSGSLSGPNDFRLAIVNHRTLGVGEANEVPTANGQKVSIRLIQIKENAVVIRVIQPPQPDLIELTLRKGAQ